MTNKKELIEEIKKIINDLPCVSIIHRKSPCKTHKKVIDSDYLIIKLNKLNEIKQ